MHKVYLNVSPINIVNLFSVVNEHERRRDPTYFEVPYSRLKSLDKTLRLKGPKVYNSVVNSINKELLTANCDSNIIHVESKFLNPFKKAITHILAHKQNAGDKEWDKANFELHVI